MNPGGTGGAPFPDRCVVPGPPPAVGRSDGSEYRLGRPSTYLDIYPTYDYLSLGDVNGDRRPDLLASTDGDLHLYLATGPATLGALMPLESGLTSGGYRAGAHFALVDADEGLDVVAAHARGMSVVWNDGSGDLSRFALTPGPPTTQPVVVDVDLDGDMDVVGLRSDFTMTNDVVLFYFNGGDGGFTTGELVLGAHLYRLRVADVTGDYLPDLIVVSGNDATISVHAQVEGGTFELAGELPVGISPSFNVWLATGDLDGDGLVDLVIVQDEDEPDIEHVWISHQRNGGLEPPRAVTEIPKGAGNIAGGAVLVSDLNLDGLADIAFTSSAFDMVAMLKRSDGSYRLAQTEFPTAASILDLAIAVGDVNCDGCPDLLGAQVDQLVLFPGVACAH